MHKVPKVFNGTLDEDAYERSYVWTKALIIQLVARQGGLYITS